MNGRDETPGVERWNPTRLTVPASAWIAPGAVLAGDVALGEHSSVWFGCVLRGDLEPIRIGRDSNVQDLTVVHVDRGMPVDVGDRVTIGHRAVIHGCTIGDDVLIGMGAIVLSGARVGSGALVAAGAVVREGFEVPEGAVVAGVPARVRGRVDEGLRERIRDGAASYVAASTAYRHGRVRAHVEHVGENEP